MRRLIPVLSACPAVVPDGKPFRIFPGIVLAFVLAGSSSAMASSSIQVIGSDASTGAKSIILRTCATCPPIKPVEVKKEYKVPELTPGTQSIIVREIDGQKKVLRTEAWMGGSPVVFVSKPTPEALEAAGEPPEGIDPATTAAVSPTAKPAPAALDVSSFNLRQSH
jgi:hypothetical protein